MLELVGSNSEVIETAEIDPSDMDAIDLWLKERGLCVFDGQVMNMDALPFRPTDLQVQLATEVSIEFFNHACKQLCASAEHQANLTPLGELGEECAKKIKARARESNHAIVSVAPLGVEYVNGYVSLTVMATFRTEGWVVVGPSDQPTERNS